MYCILCAQAGWLCKSHAEDTVQRLVTAPLCFLQNARDIKSCLSVTVQQSLDSLAGSSPVKPEQAPTVDRHELNMPLVTSAMITAGVPLADSWQTEFRAGSRASRVALCDVAVRTCMQAQAEDRRKCERRSSAVTRQDLEVCLSAKPHDYTSTIIIMGSFCYTLPT